MSVGKDSILRVANADAKKTEVKVETKPAEEVKAAAKAEAAPAAKKAPTKKTAAKKAPAKKTAAAKPKKTAAKNTSTTNTLSFAGIYSFPLSKIPTSKNAAARISHHRIPKSWRKHL